MRKRDKIIHGHWSITDEEPDALIWANTDDVLVWRAALLELEPTGEPQSTRVKPPVYEIYKAGHFDAILNELHAAYTLLMNLALNHQLLRKPLTLQEQTP